MSLLRPVRPQPAYSLFHIDDCMFVAAMEEDDAVAFVKRECGNDCAESVERSTVDLLVETADVDEGEQPSATSKRPARDLVDDHLAQGGTLPWTVCFDGE